MLGQVTIFYVKPNATGLGTSWEDASGSLNDVLKLAAFGDEVWLAEGTYHPTNDNDRTASFHIPDGVRVYGGFAGFEKILNQRNWIKHKTILSGNIGSPTFSDNSHTVVYFRNASVETILDGLIISDGCANQLGLSGESTKSGGAVYNNGSGEDNFSNPTFKNCTFKNNYALDGAAVYNNGMNGGNASPDFLNCIFENNRAEVNGGAFFNDGHLNGVSNPVLKNCAFHSNEANYGGAFMNFGKFGQAHPVLIKCQFENNIAFTKGGAIFNINQRGRAYVTCDTCQFTDNLPSIKTIFENETEQIDEE